MEKKNFTVVGKQIIHSNQKNADYCMVHIIVPFDPPAILNGASGSQAITTMVTPEEYNNITISNYNGYIIQNGRYTSVAFEEKL